MEESFNLTVIISALCGLVMVTGGIALLWRGAISLDAVSQHESLSLEWKKQFRLTTHVPAVGLFIIGLLFIVPPLWIAKPKDLPIVMIEGEKGEEIEGPIKIKIETEPWSSLKAYKNTIKEEVDLNSIVLVVKATSEFHKEKAVQKISLSNLLNRDIDLGEVTLSPSVDESVLEGRKKAIDNLTPNMEASTFQPGAFGK